MRVIHVVEAFGGGIYTFLQRLTLEDDKNEHIVVYSRRTETPDSVELDFPNISLIPVNMQREISILEDIKSCIDLKRQIQKINPDIIHAHSSKAGVYVRLLSLIDRDKIPVIYNPHGLSFLQQNESFFKRNIYLYIERVLTVLVPQAIYIGVSEQEYQEIQFKLKSKNLYLIRNAVVPKKIEEKEKIFDFVTLGRICKQKNPQLFNQLALKYPHKKFLWIGDGEEREFLNSPNIEVSGWLQDKKKIESLLESSRIYVQFSLWEGLPLALLEAMSCGLPCLVTECIGVKEVIERSQNGKVINYNLQNIESIVNDLEEKYSWYSKSSINSIKDYYNVANMIKGYQNLYEEVKKNAIKYSSTSL